MSFQEVDFSDAYAITKYPNKPFTAYYLGHREVETNLGISTLHEFKKEDGTQFAIWGFTILDKKLEMIDKGSLVRITYTGKENRKTKYGQKDVHTCKVEVDNTKSIADTLQPAVPANSNSNNSGNSAQADDDLPF